MRPADAVPPVIVLRKTPTPAQRRVLSLMAEAPSYAQVGERLRLAEETVRCHVLALADLLPASFLPDARPKERVIVYAIRVWALAQIAQTHQEAA